MMCSRCALRERERARARERASERASESERESARARARERAHTRARARERGTQAHLRSLEAFRPRALRDASCREKMKGTTTCGMASRAASHFARAHARLGARDAAKEAYIYSNSGLIHRKRGLLVQPKRPDTQQTRP